MGPNVPSVILTGSGCDTKCVILIEYGSIAININGSDGQFLMYGMKESTVL